MSGYDLMGLDGPLVGGADAEILGDELLGAMMEGDDLAGDELLGDELLGARRRKMVRRAMAARAQSGVPTGRPALFSKIPGVNAPAVGRLPLGFGIGSITVAGATGVTVTARPQVPWRGSKLSISVNGVNSGNYAVSVRPVVGNKPVLAGAGTIDARAFPATGIDNNLICDSAAPGIDVTLEFAITPALGAGDTVLINSVWIGDAVV